MNINLKLVLPLINSEGVVQNIRVDSNILLNPFYATEGDIVPTFQEVITEDHLPLLRKILFNSSITAKRKTNILESLKLKPEEIYSIRRDYTICLAILQFASSILAASATGGVQSKSLGDFAVTLSSKNSVKDVVQPIMSNAKACIAEIEKDLEELELNHIFPVTFIKGSKNENNFQANDRLWWLKEFGGYKHGYASDKRYYKGQYYKTVNPIINNTYYDPIRYYTTSDGTSYDD